MAEESADKQRRRDMLKKIMQQVKGNQDLLNNENVNKLDELISKMRPRRCNSMINFKGEDQETDPREIKSEPPNSKPEWEQEEPAEAEKIDNVYADSKPSDPLGKMGKTFTDFEG